MRLPFLFAKRYLVSKKSTNAINIISAISMSGIIVGSAALIIVLSVFNGFEDLVVSLYNSFNPDVRITYEKGKSFDINASTLDKLANMEGVIAYSKILEENALVKYGDKQYIATIKGVDENYNKATDIDSAIIRGVYQLKDQDINYAVIGNGIELALFVNIDDSYSSLRVLIPKKGNKTYINPEDAFNQLNIYPIGVFSIQKEIDDQYVIVPLSFAEKMLGSKNKLSSIELRLNPKIPEAESIAEVKKIFGSDFKIETRYEQNRFLYKVMKTEKLAAYLILTFILIIAAFNMIGSLSMVVLEKTRDIAILKVLGGTRTFIGRIFLYQGFLMACVGYVIGASIAYLLCWGQLHYKFLKLDGLFVIDAFPVKMQLFDFVVVLATVLIIGLLASWLPARKAALQEKLVRAI